MLRFFLRVVMVFGAVWVVSVPLRALAQTACPLSLEKPYRASGSASVYYISSDCVKRPIKSPAVYFSHFSSWADVRITTAARLQSIPDHPLSFLPWGPRREFQNGSLVKTVDDPRVYLLVGGRAYPIASEQAFRDSGLQWSWIEDVTAEALARFVTSDHTIAADRIAVLLKPVKYPDAPKTPPPPPPSGTPVTVGISDPTRIVPQSVVALPAYNMRFTDLAFGTTLRRITDRVRMSGFGTHIYSQLQAFSQDDAYMLLSEDGYVVRRVDTLAASPLNLSNINAPRWQPARAHTLVFYDSNEDATLRVQYGNADTGATETWYTFPAAYERLRSNQSFDELSHDGRWIAGMAAMSDGDRMIYALDLTNRTLGAQISLNSLFAAVCQRDPQYGILEPDWIGVSPLGNYLVVQWERDGVARCSGMETFNIQSGQFVGRVNSRHTHGDLGLDADGRTEVLMTFELLHPADNNRPSQSVRVLPGPAAGEATPRYLQVMDWGNQSHISCQGPNGSCLVTASGDISNGYNSFEGELFLQYMDGRVLRLAHHRSTSCGYWVQPRASWSRSGRYAIFASDWGTCRPGTDGLGLGEAYLIELPAGVL